MRNQAIFQEFAKKLNGRTVIDTLLDEITTLREQVENKKLRKASPASVPEGWKLVPVKPTEEMLVAMTSYNMPENNYRAMLAAAPTPPVSDDRWLPIETAPKNGTAFRAYAVSLIDLDFNPEGSVECAWDGECFIGCVWNGQQDAWYGKEITPTHWMPLPKAPAMQEDKS